MFRLGTGGQEYTDRTVRRGNERCFRRLSGDVLSRLPALTAHVAARAHLTFSRGGS